MIIINVAKHFYSILSTDFWEEEFWREEYSGLASTCRVERNNQILFPDFFPPGMHVHCAQNALPEASKGLYMKIIQGNNEIDAASNFCITQKTSVKSPLQV